MGKFGESSTEKQAEETRNKDKRGAGEKLAWYKTWRGILSSILIIILLIVIWKFRGIIKIEVSNCYVALVAVGFTYLFLRILRFRSRVLKFVFGFLWVLLLPNTAYLFTDLGHMIYQWNNTASLSGRMLLFVQYLLLVMFGIITFLYSFLPFEVIVERVNLFTKRKVTWLVLFNFLVAYGLVLGRFEHINSWVLFTNPLKVLGLAINIFATFNLLGLTILLGLLCNFVYFLFRVLLLQWSKKYFETLDY